MEPFPGINKRIILKKAPKADITFNLVILTIIGILALVQIVGLILPSIGIPRFAGPAALVVAVFTVVILAFGMAKRYIEKQPISPEDYIVIIIAVVLTILGMIYLRDFLPEIFEEGARQVSVRMGLI